MFNVKDKRVERAEKMLEAFGDVGDIYLNEAYITDDAEKLDALKKEDKKKKRLGRSMFFWYKTAALVSCLAIIASTLIYGYIGGKNVSEPVKWDGFEAIDSKVEIDSINMLNYYSARRALGLSGESVALVGTDIPISYGNIDDVKGIGEEDDDGGDVIYYEFDPTWDYTVSKVLYFRAVLKEPKGFLAEKLGGIGEMDVFITENSIEDMITFRKGNSYYSCHINSLYSDSGSECLEFVTHKYIDGFNIVKNFAQDNYSFKVKLEKGRIVELDCDYWECSDGIWDREADRIGIVSGSFVSVKTKLTVDIKGLESFFNSIADGETVADTWSTRRRGSAFLSARYGG